MQYVIVQFYLDTRLLALLITVNWIYSGFQLVNAYLSLLSRKYDNIAVVDSFWKEKPAFNDEWLLKEIVFFPYYTPCHWSLLVSYAYSYETHHYQTI